MNLTPFEFLAEVSEFESRFGPAFRLAKIDPSYTAGTLPRLIFDGETELTVKRYVHISSYTPQASDRVVLGRIGVSWVILGSIGTVSVGRIAREQVTSSQGPITGTIVDLTGLSLTFTPPAGRLIRVEGRCNFLAVNSGAPSVARFTLTNAAGEVSDQDTTGINITSTVATNALKLRVTHEFVGEGTSVTFKLRAAGSGGDGVTASSTGSRPGVIAAFDDGPA